jgi:hypothetical protein
MRQSLPARPEANERVYRFSIYRHRPGARLTVLLEKICQLRLFSNKLLRYLSAKLLLLLQSSTSLEHLCACVFT